LAYEIEEITTCAPMKPIPVSAARRIAQLYGYDQVVIVARKVSNPGDDHEGREHCTTYGIDKANCDVAARIGNFFKFNLMKWTGECDCANREPRK
jgi:hypothetical protein